MTGAAAALARAAMALAVQCLGQHRRDWALAMEAEFEAAGAEGRALAFAFGCLWAAVRELPAHGEGRLALANHALALVLVLPMAALPVSSLLAGFPYSYFGDAGVHGLGGLGGGQEPLLSEANRAAVPSLALLILLLAGAQLRLAWLMLERDWTRVAATAMLIAAATVTLGILAGLVFDLPALAPIQAAVLAVELASVAALARWHGELASSG